MDNPAIFSNNGPRISLSNKDNGSVTILSKSRPIFGVLTPDAMLRRRGVDAARHGVALVTLAMLAFLGSTGCVAYVRPGPGWAMPIDLDLHQESLAGTRIKVDCALDDGEGQLTADEGVNCAKLRRVVGQLGARILLDDPPAELLAEKNGTAAATKDSAAARAPREQLPRVIGNAKTETPDVTILYVAKEAESNHCGWSILLFIGTFGLGPCIENITSTAELRLTDVRSGRQTVRAFQVPVRRILGATALVLLLSDLARPLPRREERRLLGGRFLHFVQNEVFTFVVRDRLEAIDREGGRDAVALAAARPPLPASEAPPEPTTPKPKQVPAAGTP